MRCLQICCQTASQKWTSRGAQAQETVWIWSKSAGFKGWGWEEGGGREGLGGFGGNGMSPKLILSQEPSTHFYLNVPCVKNLRILQQGQFVGTLFVCFSSPKMWASVKKHVKIRQPDFPFFLAIPARVTCITEGRGSTCVNKTVIYRFASMSSHHSWPIRVLPPSSQPCVFIVRRRPSPSPAPAAFHLINIHFQPNWA